MTTAATSEAAPRQAWIFQANPKLFDAARAVRERDTLTWMVTSYRSRVRAGDRVYLWEAGPEAGIIAVATVLTEPTVMAADPRDAEYGPPDEKLDAEQPRVELQIDQVLNERLFRRTLKETPALSQLSILRFANATNFEVTPNEDAVLMTLIESREERPQGGASGGESGSERALVRDELCRLIPSEDDRREVLARLRESIVHAHVQGESNWCVTLPKSRVIRLTVGATQAFVIRDSFIQLIVDEGRLNDALRRELSPYIQSQEEYRMIPSAFDVKLPASDMAHVYPLVREAHFAFIEKSGAMRCPFLRFHSEAITEHLREVLGGDVPNPTVPQEKPRRGARYWKIAPGSGGQQWEMCRDRGFIAMHWDRFGHVGRMGRAEFDACVEAVMREDPELRRSGLEQIWKFAHISEGDQIIANAGTREILGVGTVTGPYYFVEGEKFGHRLPVDWHDTTRRSVDRPGWRRTVIQLKEDDVEELLQGQVSLDANEEGEEDTGERSPTDFVGILSSLEDRKLFFPEELVANYLLALQTKRFVILSGISGTGKTQLALEVAKAFAGADAASAANPRTSSDPGFVLEVKPYMHKHRRFMVPAQLAADYMALRPPRPGERWVDLELPDGRRLDIVAYNREGTNLLQLLLRGEAGEWIRSTPLGARFILDIVGEGEHARLRISEAASVVTDVVPQKNYEVIPVRPDWTDNSGLLGFYNPLTKHYTVRPFLRLLLDAKREHEAAQREKRHPRPFFAILDEMNLARVEHYFADVLSAMESEEPIDLHDDDKLAEGETEDGLQVPKQLTIPPNVFLVGTVNVDETTYMFSPKVLDRAFTLEFNTVRLGDYAISLDRLSEDEEDVSSTPLALDKFDGNLRFASKPSPEDWKALGQIEGGRYRDSLLRLNDVLSEENRHFGYRVANEIARFVMLAVRQTSSGSESAHAAFDLAVLEKVLPKLHGTQQELEPILDRLFAFATGGPPERESEVEWRMRDGELVGAPSMGGDVEAIVPELPRTAWKLWRMRKRLRQQGFTAFIE